MMIYVILAAGKWRRLGVEIITINFLNIHLDYASIFWEGEQRESERARDDWPGWLKACWLNGAIK